jgi:hypothetical protein
LSLRHGINILISVFLFLSTANLETAVNPVTIAYQGSIYEIPGYISEGVISVKCSDIVNIIDKEQVYEGENIQYSNELITIRKFTEITGLKILWEEKTKTIIFTGNVKPSKLSNNDIKLISQVLAIDWLNVKSKEDAFNYFSKFLSPSLSKVMAEDVWNFVKEPTDWHFSYSLGNLSLLDEGVKYKVILATIIENQGNKHNEGYGLFTIEQQHSGEWLVTGMRFSWPNN